ncbi:MAG TPA: hypothetical protein VEQ09_06635, partial [Aquabacterium sp.]|nr:hypothetical protein [Aquabacterium sp.]
DFHGDGLIGLTIDRAAFDALVDNAGTLQADGGVVALSARSANALVDQVVNNTGLIQAQSLVARNGRIVLDGGDSGTTHVSGTLDASANDGQGGRITVTGQHIVLDGGATLNAAGATGGGQIHVGGGYQGRDSGIANASTVTADASVRADASATGNGEGGQVVFWSDDTTRFAGQIAVRGGQDGGNGGLAEVSGKRLLAYSGRTDAQASQGRTGDLLLDPSTLTIQAGAATGDITGSTVTVADLEAQNANVLLQATGIITFADLSLNGGNGKLSMANNVSLRVEGCTSGACTTNEGISFVNASNTVEVFGTGSLMFVAGATGTGYLTNIGTLIAHGAGSNPGTLPTHSVTSVGSGTPGAGSITLYGADGITIGGSLTTNGGYVRLWGDSDNMGGGGLTLSAPITSNGGNLYVSAGSGAIDLNSSMTLGAGRLYFKADGSYTNGAKSLSGTLSASGDVDVNTPFTMNAGASILTDGVIRLSSTVNLNTGSGVLTLRGSAIDFTGATLQNLSTASMRLEPADASVNMVLGDASGFASASTLAALPGIKNLTIGRNDGTGTISVPSGGFSFNATGTLELVNRNVVIGTAGDPTSTLTNTTGNITITSDNIGIVQAVTANGGAGKVTLRQQTAANELHLGGGISNASVGQINAATLAVGRADGGNLVFDSDITTSATSVHLMSGNQVLGVNGGVSAANLAITAGQGATISASAFNFTTLAASLGGSTVASSTITSSAASWGLGTVDGLAGLTMQVGSTPTVTLTAANALSLNAPIAFNNTASTLNLRGQTLDASGATVSGQTNASVSFDRPTSGGTLTYGGTSGDVKQATLSKFNNSRNLTVGSTGETVTAVGAVNVAVGNQLTIQGDTLTGLSGANTLTATAGSLKLLAAQGPLILDANVSAAATLSLEAGTGQTISGSGTLSADKLAIRAQGGAVTLASATHQVNTLAASAGRLQFKNGKTLTVGSVDGLTGVHATDTVDLRATGGTSDLVLNQVVVADNSSASAVPLLLAAGRNFVNNAGAGALTATGGSWRVY